MTSSKRITNDVLAERLGAVQGQLTGIEVFLRALDARSHKSEIDAVLINTRVEGKADAAHRRIDDHGTQIDALNKSINAINATLSGLVWTQRMLAFVGSAVGISIVALIWSLITGQAHVAFGSIQSP